MLKQIVINATYSSKLQAVSERPSPAERRNVKYPLYEKQFTENDHFQ